MTTTFQLADFIDLATSDKLEAAACVFAAWDETGGPLSFEDTVDRCEEDDRSYRARVDVESWFEFTFLSDHLLDDEEVYADGFTPDEELVIEGARDYFIDLLFEDLREAHDVALTYRSLPR
jgi:hypothetical protein